MTITCTVFESIGNSAGSQINPNWDELTHFLSNIDAYPTKDSQPLIKLGTFQNDSRAKHSPLLTFTGIEIDYDACAVSIDQITQLLQQRGVTAFVCSTHSSTPFCHKWRAFLPTTQAYDAGFRKIFYTAVNNMMGGIASDESGRDKQTYFIGKNFASDYKTNKIDGECFDVVLSEEIAELSMTMPLEEDNASEARTFEPVVDGQVDMVQAFNDTYTIEDLLDKHGYEDQGNNRYKSPTSESKVGGVIISEDGETCWSFHGELDPLADGRPHDAFDVLRILECNGDYSEAYTKADEATTMPDGKSVSEYNLEVLLKDNELFMQGIGQIKDKVVHENDLPQPQEEEEPSVYYEESQTEPREVYKQFSDNVPDHLIDPPFRMFNDLCRYINATSHRRQPVFAVSAALSLFSTVLGRKVQGHTGVRTNLYLCSLGITGGGKEHGRKVIKNILRACDMGDYVGGEGLASSSGLKKRLVEFPNSVFQIDEFGMILRELKVSAKRGSPKAGIVAALLDMFSAANSVVTGDEYSTESRKDIYYPCVNIHATSTPEAFYDALEAEEIVNGFLNRIITCESMEKLPERNFDIPDIPIPESVTSWATGVEMELGGRGVHKSLMGIDPACPLKVPATDEAKQMLRGLSEWCDKQIRENDSQDAAMYNRAYEHALKVALVVACCDARYIHNAIIEASHAQWAIDFVMFWTDRILKRIRSQVSGNEYEKQRNAALEVINRKGKLGATMSDLKRSSRLLSGLKPRDMETILSDLVELEEIDYVHITLNNGRTRKAWVTLIQDEDD